MKVYDGSDDGKKVYDTLGADRPQDRAGRRRNLDEPRRAGSAREVGALARDDQLFQCEGSADRDPCLYDLVRALRERDQPRAASSITAISP